MFLSWYLKCAHIDKILDLKKGNISSIQIYFNIISIMLPIEVFISLISRYLTYCILTETDFSFTTYFCYLCCLKIIILVFCTFIKILFVYNHSASFLIINLLYFNCCKNLKCLYLAYRFSFLMELLQIMNFFKQIISRFVFKR